MNDAPRQHGSDADPSPARPPRFADRLLAETVRSFEDLAVEPIDDARACDAAASAGGDLERRLVARARAMPVAAELGAAVSHVRRALTFVAIAIAAIGLLAGAATARAALGGQRDAPVNFFLVIGSVLGVQTLLLAMWFVLMIARPRALAGGSLGGLALAATRWIVARLHRGPAHVAAAHAVGRVLATGRIGRWTLSAISHGVWLSFNVGAIATVMWLLSARQYAFGWETTILSERTYTQLTRALAAAPRVAGFDAPTARQIAASQWTGSGPLPVESALAWSGLLVGSMVLYGFGPRILLLGLSLGRRRAGWRAFRLDVSAPGYASLRPRLMPTTRLIGVVDSADDATESADDAPVHDDRAAARPVGPPAILGFELETPTSGWPPPIDGSDCRDLGIVDGRDDQRRTLDALAAAARYPQLVAAVCALTQTPDRGVEDFLRQVQAASGSPLVLVLTGGDALRRRVEPAEQAQRIDDWHRLAEHLGIEAERTVEIDLEHLTPASRAKLLGALGGESSAQPPARHIEQAFTCIVEQVRGWRDAPSLAQQGALHRSIAIIYQHAGRTWRDLLNAPAALEGDLAGRLRDGAETMVRLLPARLKASRRWLAAGAAAGALGCVAAATMLTPVAIAGLPIWAGVGAAIAGLLRPNGTSHEKDDDSAGAGSHGEAIRAAALFALLLELQGRDEVRITRCLDQAIGDDEPADDRSSQSAAAWLDRVRHRLDLALTSEPGR